MQMQKFHSIIVLATHMFLQSHQSQTTLTRKLFPPESDLSQSSIIHSAIMWLSIQSPFSPSRTSVFIRLAVAGNLPSTLLHLCISHSVSVSLLHSMSPTHSLTLPPSLLFPSVLRTFLLFSPPLLLVLLLSRVIYLLTHPFLSFSSCYLHFYPCLPIYPSQPLFLLLFTNKTPSVCLPTKALSPDSC